MHPWKLAETNYGTVRQHEYEVAVLPLGATEPHNLHLPYSMDTREGDLVGEKICEAAHRRGAKVILLPTVPYGTQTNQMQFPLAMNLNPSTLTLVISDLVDSLVQHGILKIVLLNSHGGNDLKPVLRELYGQTPAQLFLCNWYAIFDDVYEQIFEQPDNHAGEMETSIALAYCPELVARKPDGSLTADGAIYWNENPTNWRPYSVNGSSDQYFIRAHLESGDYASQSPVENLIRTDIIFIQYLDNITSSDQTLVVVPEYLWVFLTIIPFIPKLAGTRRKKEGKEFHYSDVSH